MNNSQQFKGGFTLLEVLIATAIFAVVMVMTSGVIAQSTSFQSKIKAMRDASEEAGRISDAIARDLKTTGGSFTVTDASSPVKGPYVFKNGVVLTDATGRFITDNLAVPPNVSVGMSSANYPASAVIINTRDSVRVYVNKAGAQSIIYAKTYVKSDSAFSGTGCWWSNSTNTLSLTSSSGNLITVTAVAANAISDATLDTAVAFTGYAASSVSGSVNVQSYITYFVHARTKGYDTTFAVRPNERAEAYIRSMVTKRDYSN